jgi:hypothetical protein
MKTKQSELDMDFIGGESALTVEEEIALSEFFKNRKLSSSKKISKQILRIKKIKKEKV